MSSEHGRPQESVAETTPQGPHVAALGEESGAASGVVGADGRGVLEDAEVAARKRSIAKLRNVVWAAGPARGLVYFKVQHVRDALAAYDALLAERDALKAELDDQREAYRKTIEDECATDEKHCACVPFLRSEVKRISDECDEGRCPSAEHERLAAAALREKAEALHDRYRKATENWHKCWDCLYPTLVEHAPDCPASPDFLTTSATESREAKGGTT